ncbi:molybdenum cofactor biosynthesis protein MoaE [Candidatus Bathyarchaeota archaeon]|nr:molybdenum cofactor biosynthesis protein MoaE [Candidatus Bathyarchaeota archaeon]
MLRWAHGAPLGCQTDHGQSQKPRGWRHSSLRRYVVKRPSRLNHSSHIAGTTRDNFAGKPVRDLKYTAYQKLALKSMMDIAKSMYAKHSLKGIALIHRLGTVPIGEESILIAVSSPHREAAWRAGEEALEECKSRVEIWKLEEFEGEEGVWRANRDGAAGQRL